eukprot:TRINITY_DN188_c0_g1_i4.p1 TRINITY_DN188_c0_g1~~TRINITY_DN188_c0_g1_i4.p1  ORF type:complete len:540 (+),score=160.61 TRINITY_DN188_c0_g1_i4:66-1685(+)
MDPLSSFRARGNRNKDDVNASTPHSESHSARSAVVAEEDPRSAETPLSKDILGRNTSHSEKENPFAMPSDDEVFALRDEERRKKKESREQSRNLHVWEKPTWSSKMGTTRLFQEGEEPEDGEGDEKKGEAGGHGDRRREKENLNDFIAKKREMFLVQMSLDTKRDEMRKLEERARQREEALKKSEQMLEEDAMRFDAFLKENDMKAVEAIKRAENESKLKLEKVQEIKKLNAQIMAIKSDMSKDEEQLEECRRYKEFLDSLTPPEWLAEQQTLKQKRIQEKKAKKAAEKAKGNTANADGKAVAPKKDVKKDATSSTTKSGGTNDGDESEDDDDDIPMYFTNPQQLLDIFAALEESNLFLIQNSQETEEALEEIKQKFHDTKAQMDKETESLKAQIEQLKKDIENEEEAASNLIERSNKNLGGENTEKILNELNQKVAAVYSQCGFDNDANISTLQMLTNIEAKLEELFKLISCMPPEEVESAEKAKEKSRREKARGEKIEFEKKKQEDKVQRALMRSQAPVMKKVVLIDIPSFSANYNF